MVLSIIVTPCISNIFLLHQAQQIQQFLSTTSLTFKQIIAQFIIFDYTDIVLDFST